MLHHMLRAAAQRAFSTLDPYFKYVTMLLHGDGSALGSDTVTPFNSDASTNAFNVTINGDARSNNFNPYQAGYYSNSFNGSSDYLTMPDNANYVISGDFTVEAWIYPTSFAGTNGNIVLAQWPGSTATNQSFQFYVNSTGKVGLVYGIGATNAAVVGTSLSCTLNTWNHIAVTRSGTTVRYFVNGALDATSATVSGAFNDSTGVMSVGRINASDSGYFSGYISNCRLVIGTALYTSAFTPSTTPLTAVSGTQVLVCQSNRFIDNSSNAATITVNGNTSIAPAQPFTLPTTVATYGSGYFDGSGDYLSVPDSSSTEFGSGDFTVECWAYYSSTSGTPVLIDKRASTGGYSPFIFYTTGGTLVFYASSNGSSYDIANGVTIGTVVANQWYHVAASRSGTSIRLFLNGVLGNTVTSSAALVNNSDAWTLGGTVGGNYLTGYLSNVRFVKGTAVYTSAFTPPTAPLTAITNTSLLTTQYNGAGNNNGFKDSSQNNFVITRNGNTTQGTFSPYGSNWSNYFDGNGDYLSFPNNTAFTFGTGDFTVECWVFRTGTGSGTNFYESIIGGNESTPNYWNLYVNSSNNTIVWYGNDNTLRSTSNTITNNLWNHVAVARSGTTLKIFINGVEGYTATVTTSYSLGSAGGRIGYDGPSTSTGNKYFNGYISNARVVKGTAVYTSAFTPPTSPLTAITNTSLLTCADNRFIDDSTNAFAITATGETSVQRFSPFAPSAAYSTTVIGGSGYFDGTGDYLTVPNNTAFDFGSGNFTLEAMVFPLTTTPSSSVFGKRASGAVYAPFNFGFGGTLSPQLLISFNGSSWAVNFTSSISCFAQAWNHVAVTRNGSTFTIWVNGQSGGTASNASAVMTNTTAVSIGATAADGTSPFNGYITDARIVKGTAVYTSAFTPPTAPLTATTSTQLLLSTTNAGIFDNAMMNDLETVGNAQISTSVKKYGTGSMYFDGTGDYLFRPSSSLYDFGTGDFTIEMWVYRNGSQVAYAGLVGFSVDSGNGLILGFGNADNKLRVVWNNAQTILASSAMTNTTWTHVALVRSGATVTCYQDGTSVGTYNISTNAMPFTGAGMVIGRLVTNTDNYYFNGYIDDLRITKGVARYTTTFTPPTAAFPNN